MKVTVLTVWVDLPDVLRGEKNWIQLSVFQSATLLSGQEEPEPKTQGSGDSSSDDDEEEEEQKLDLSSTTK